MPCVLKLVAVLILLTPPSRATIQALRDLIQFNLVGHPVLHKQTAWDFEPEVGLRRSRQYQELNGRLGEKAIERLGLGIDGYDRERLLQQRTRDEGHLNGADDFED